jgi:carboxylesterase
MIKDGIFSGQKTPRGIFLVDPIVVSSNKTLTLVGVLGPVLGYTTTDLDDGETGKWYVYRPQESLKQLMQLIDITRKDLEKGMKLPDGSMAKIYKSIIDRTADPVSASLIHRGLKKADGKTIQVEMLDSELHVMTRLRGRDNITSKDVLLQRQIFADMESIMQGEN